MKNIWKYLALVGLLIALTSFYNHNSSYFLVEIWFVIEITVLTCLTRSVGLFRGALALLNGIFLGAGSTLLTAWVFGLVGIDINETFWQAYVFPWIEEIAKLLPVLFFTYLLFKREKVLPNISDFLFLGVMGGAGFSLFEKYFWNGISFDLTYGPHFGNIYFFPDALGTYVSGDVLGYVGHSAATGLIAMAIGIGLYLKNKKKFDLWWIAPLVALSWIAIEHMLLNLYYANGSETLLLIGGGLLTPWIFLAVMIVGIVLDGKVTLKFLKDFPGVKKELKKDTNELLLATRKSQFPIKKWKMFAKKLRLANLIGWNR